MRRLFLAAVLVFGLTSSVGAGFEEGATAYKRGDYAIALYEWRPLAEKGHADARNNLGFMYQRGLGVAQDIHEAARWYRLAAEQGAAIAQHNIGLMYEYGVGVPPDYVQAHKWLSLAVSWAQTIRIRDMAVKNRDLIARKMTPAQIREAQRLARYWKPKPSTP